MAHSDARRYITIANWSDRRDSNSFLLVRSQGCLPLHHDLILGLATGVEPEGCTRASCFLLHRTCIWTRG
ncbi:hypothetical protein H6F87_25820 [Cyanobacteria bacterium FACHB-502]|nr:hypothetical protein [Cyanobacteria bacterium FACHB-502]